MFADSAFGIPAVHGRLQQPRQSKTPQLIAGSSPHCLCSRNHTLLRRGASFQGEITYHPHLHPVLMARRSSGLSGPLNKLNAILSLLHPLDRYRNPSAIGSAIGKPLSRPISHPNAGGSPQPPRSKPLGGLDRAIVVP